MIYKKLLILAGALFPISLAAVSFIYPAFTGEDSQWFGLNRLTVAELGEIPFVAVCMFAFLSAIRLMLGGGQKSCRLDHPCCGIHPPENEHPESGRQRPSMEDPGRCGESRSSCGS